MLAALALLDNYNQNKKHYFKFHRKSHTYRPTHNYTTATVCITHTHILLCTRYTSILWLKIFTLEYDTTSHGKWFHCSHTLLPKLNLAISNRTRVFVGYCIEAVMVISYFYLNIAELITIEDIVKVEKVDKFNSYYTHENVTPLRHVFCLIHNL